ncbi:MAG: cob(I)yrinic acid a,c-diamide adenosyltransferase [Clostridiales Family XIII bacterium]|jgi:cob(I)alamin adenosyltransferase|nr:cob(I)yrinic acid a,c-diamide adenosyltransferase [Clostridiales Family XIII bacterium]
MIGMTHVYYGEGQGKTSAAMGLAMRALGNGKRVFVAQFFKGNESGEIRFLQQTAGVTIIHPQPGMKFTWEMDEDETAQMQTEHDALFSAIQEAASSGDYDLLILDEVLTACIYDHLRYDLLLQFIQEKPDSLELVLTGHGISKKIMDAADYVTEMTKHKHPYDLHVMARAGVEY